MRHGAEPWEELAVKLMLKWPNLYYSTSAFAPKHYPKAIIDYANTRGADKVMYAGYFPMGLTLDRIFSSCPTCRFRDDVWPKFLRENATAPLLPRAPPGGLARRRGFRPRAGCVLPAPRRPSRPRRLGEGHRHRVPVPRLDVRRRAATTPASPTASAPTPRPRSTPIPSSRSPTISSWPGSIPTTSRPSGSSSLPPEATSDEFTEWRTVHFVVNAATQELAENTVDGPHFRYVHNTDVVPEIESYDTNGWVARTKTMQRFPTPRGVVDGRIDIENQGPASVRTWFRGIVDTLPRR
jgi:hypothetical protein